MNSTASLLGLFLYWSHILSVSFYTLFCVLLLVFSHCAVILYFSLGFFPGFFHSTLLQFPYTCWEFISFLVHLSFYFIVLVFYCWYDLDGCIDSLRGCVRLELLYCLFIIRSKAWKMGFILLILLTDKNQVEIPFLSNDLKYNTILQYILIY